MKITVTTDLKHIPITRKIIKETLQKAAEKEKWRGNINVAIIDDREIADINTRFLNRNNPTDVLAFFYGDDSKGVAGEIIVSAETAKRVAATYNESPGRELLRYCVHGFLHLCGYDDLNVSERKVMEKQQERILSACHPLNVEEVK